MREILEAVASGELSPAAAEAELAGYATDEAGRFDAARADRTGIPEAVLAEGKTPEETARLASLAVETTGRALVTRASEPHRAAVRATVDETVPTATVETDDRSRWVVVHAADYEPPELDASLGVVTAGTSDAPAAGEAAVVAREMGAQVTRLDDVGVAALTRLVDQLAVLREQDALVVAAGREGALPTVVAGLVDSPVIALPTAVGYGAGGDGEAALLGMLQSCTPLTVVNIDAGFAAGAQAGLICRAVAQARS